jgi:endo-1,4-beta-xylanase
MPDQTHPSPGRLDRRSVLRAGVAFAALPPARASLAAGPGSTGLDGIARSRNLRFGSAVNWGPPGGDQGSFANPAYAALLHADCGLLVPENELKWQAIRPERDRFDTARFDEMLAWSDANGFRMRGHTLLWHHSRWFPAWLNGADFGAEPVKAAETLLRTHIETVTGRYGKRITSYDVVNEAVDPDTAGLRETSLSKAMGSAEAVLDLCFHTARQSAPHTELVYNDYMSWEAGNEKHCDGVLRLLEGFRRRGTPVDTLGVQSHIGIFQPVRSVAELADSLTPGWRRFLDAVTGMGYRLAITEFDVRDRGLPADIAERDKSVATFARAYLDIMLAYPQLTDILVWGMSDRFSWLRGFEPRPDGKITRGSPYDFDLRKKPLYHAIATAIAAAPMRQPRPTGA